MKNTLKVFIKFIKNFQKLVDKIFIYFNNIFVDFLNFISYTYKSVAKYGNGKMFKNYWRLYGER